MFDIEESGRLYLQSMLIKAQNMIDIIQQYDFVKSATLEETNIKIEFNEEVDIENQDVMDLFLRGGVIKKSKDNEYIKVEAIGEF